MIVDYNIYWNDGKNSPEPYHPEYDPFNTEFIGLAIAMAAVSMDGDINDNILRIYRSDYFKDNIDDRCFILSL